MPVIKSAIKKLRKDRKLEKSNELFSTSVERAVKAAKKAPTTKSLSAAFSLIDKAAKKKLVHKNKAARMKSTLSKLATGKVVAAPKKEVKAKAAAPKKATSTKKKTPAKKKA